MSGNLNHNGLILISGVDSPGITEKLFSILEPFQIEIIDFEQVVIRDRLLLTVLIKNDPAHEAAIEEDLIMAFKDTQLDIAIDFSIPHTTGKNEANLHLVILGQVITPSAISKISQLLNKFKTNIERVRRTATYPITALEFDVSASLSESQLSELQRDLAQISHGTGVDIAIQKGGLIRRAKRVVLLDMDSTLIQQEVIDLLAIHAGKSEEVKEITKLAMNGEIEFKEALAKRVQLLAGLPETIFEKVRSELTLSPGAESLIETLHKIGHKVGVVSGGFIEVIEPLLKKLNIDYSKANSLEIVNGKLTGKLVGAVVDRLGKQKALEEFAAREKIPLEQTVAIGDGANDIDMLATAGLGVAYNAKPSVREAADVMITTPHLDTVLYLMGIGDFAN